MSFLSSLTPEQTQLLKDLVTQGLPLGQIQSRLQTAGVQLTYMQLRLAIDDIGLSLKDAPAPDTPAATTPPPTPATDTPPEFDTMGTVSVELDTVVRPGAFVSGSVRFSDGVAVQWSLDQYGRLGLMGAPTGYKPSQIDLEDFQMKLRSLIESKSL